MKIANLNSSHSGACSLAEIVGIGGYEPRAVALETAKEFFAKGNRAGAYLFSMRTDNNTQAEQLRAYIKKNKLGRVTKQKPFTNYRYGDGGSKISLYIWFVDIEGFKQFAAANDIKKPTY